MGGDSISTVGIDLTPARHELVSASGPLAGPGEPLIAAGKPLTEARGSVMSSGDDLNEASMPLTGTGSGLTAAGRTLTDAGGALRDAGTMLTDAGRALTADFLALSAAGGQTGAMNTDQDNRVTMFKTVDAFLDENQTVWSGMAAFVTAHQALEDGIAAIDNSAEKQETPVTGAAAEKGSDRESLEGVTFMMAEALGVLGHTSDDKQLLALVAVTPSTLHSMGAEALSTRALSIHKEATTRFADLAGLNVTQANVDELKAKLDAFNASKETPRTAVAGRAAQTAAMPELIREVSGLLRNNLDRAVNLFRLSNADFVAGYRTARVIVDRGGGQKPATPAKPNP